MEVPVGFVAQLWSFLSFFPFFLSLFTLGLLKAAIIGPIVIPIILVGNTAVVIGLWPAHFVWTYFCVAKSKRVGLLLKVVVLILLPLPLLLWPLLAIVCSLLGAIGFGTFAPLISTFEARGGNLAEKMYHCFADGTWSTVKQSCTVVRDLVDFCFHSYFSYMDELIEQIPADENPIDIDLFQLPSCFLVCLIGVAVDVPLITVVALWKSPYMLFRGWKRLLEDLVGREGPFLETVCVPFAGLAIVLWPLAVVGSVIGAFVSSFFLALYGAVIVHQERSLKLGLAYVVAVVSLFDEYANDMLYLREGSCLPRPKYRRNTDSGSVRTRRTESDSRIGREGSFTSKLVSECSRTLKWQIQQYKPMQVWDWLFKSCETNGRALIQGGLVSLADVEKCIATGDCKKLGVKLPTWSILQCLLRSAKSDSPGLLISDDVELTRANGPRERVFEWFITPLLIIKAQIKALGLDEAEESCLRELVMRSKNERPKDWDDTSFPSGDKIRRAQLQAIIRRLQGLVGSISRIPTFRRRFKNLVKVLYLEALQANVSPSNLKEGASESANYNNGDLKDGDIV